MAKQNIWCVLLIAVVGMSLDSELIAQSNELQQVHAKDQDLATDEDFSCRLLLSRNKYVVGDPIVATVRLTNNMQRKFSFRDCAQHYPFYSFEVTDAAGEQLALSSKLGRSMAEINPEWRKIEPGRIYDVQINIAEWYDFAKVGRYTIKAKWSSLAKTKPSERNSSKIDIAVVPRYQKGLLAELCQANMLPDKTTSPQQFTCKISTSKNLRLFALNEPIEIKVILQHRFKQSLVFDRMLHYRDIFTFHIEDEQGRVIPTNPISGQNPPLGYNTLEPNRLYDVTADIADLYDLSSIGRYAVRAQWRIAADNRHYQGESNVIYIKLLPARDKEIIKLIYMATLPTQRAFGQVSYKLKLVELGDKAVPVLLDWLKMQKTGDSPNDKVWWEEHTILGILSEIGSKKARRIIAHSDIKPEQLKNVLLERIDVWQSKDRFGKLVKALGDPRLGRKWAIFKLGVLGDKRAITVLREIAGQDAQLDIRETAKDALAHLQDPNVPMRYIMHRPSEKITLKSSSETYRLGEPIEIDCKITGGEYGSHELAGFSNPQWHFLPWGATGADANRSQPYRIRMKNKGWRKRRPAGEGRGTPSREAMIPGGVLIPVKELSSMRRRLKGSSKEPLEGYIELSELKYKGGFVLQPGESRYCTLAGLNSAFKISEPGDYEIFAYASGKGTVCVSNTIVITILP